ncbi:hypothetical protein GCM10023238_35440 [Streptomyces heliomycini]
MHLPRPARRSVLLLTGALLLTACGSGSGSSDGPATRGARAVAFDNCGRRVTVGAPPKRAVSLNQGTTEIMLSLGLADRMAGTATWTDPVLKGWRRPTRRCPGSPTTSRRSKGSWPPNRTSSPPPSPPP